MSTKRIETHVKKIIQQSCGDVLSEKKYGGTLFSTEDKDPFCGVFCYKAHVSLEFPQGYKMSDPHGLLEGSGKYRRHIKFRSQDDIDRKVLTPYLKESKKLAR
jgi:hypothetical protein